MKLRKQFPVRERIFGKDDVRRLAKAIEEAAAKVKSNRGKITFALSTDDGEAFESDTTDLLADDGPIDLKRIAKVALSYSNYETDHHFDIELRHGGRSEVTISAQDPNWVTAAESKVRDILEAVPPRSKWINRSMGPAWVALAIVLGYLIIRVFSLISSPEDPNEAPSKIEEISESSVWARYGIFVFFALLFGGLPAGGLISWMHGLWPSVELAFGPAHKQLEAARRRRILLALSVVVIPIALELLLRLF